MNVVKPQAKAPEAPRPSKMTLAGVIRGKQERPIRALLYGVEGVGKSTFAADAPSPIFVASEDGTAHLDVPRFPAPESWSDVKEAVRILREDEHSFQTFVLDTVDWAEPLLWEFICKRDGQANIEAYGYGKGYAAALDEWRVFLASLERLREARKMNIILLAHSQIRPFKNPMGEDYDRFELKVRPNAGGLIKEWVDAVLFADFETFAEKDSKGKRKGVSTGARIIYTTRTAAFDAKNRAGLPETLPLSWADFAAAVASHQPASPEAFIAGIVANLPALSKEDKEKAEAALARAGTNVTKLAQLNSWVNAKKGEV